MKYRLIAEEMGMRGVPHFHGVHGGLALECGLWQMFIVDGMGRR